MNWDMIKGDWKTFKGKVREHFGRLTDDDMEKIAGRRDQLLGSIQKSYGVAKDEAERQLREFEVQCEQHCETTQGTSSGRAPMTGKRNP